MKKVGKYYVLPKGFGKLSADYLRGDCPHAAFEKQNVIGYLRATLKRLKKGGRR